MPPGLFSGVIAVCSYLRFGKAVRMSQNAVRKYMCELGEWQLISAESTTVTSRDGLECRCVASLVSRG